MLCHLSSLSQFVGVPFGSILGPLVVWLIKKDEFQLVDDQGREALNFNISIAIYAIVSAILLLVVIGIVLLPAVLIFHLVMTIIASIRAHAGEAYRYPLTIRFL